MMKDIVVSGGAGFIGLHLSEKLLKEAEGEIFIVEDFSRGVEDKRFSELVANPRVSVHREFSSIRSESITHIFHLASINGTKNFYQMPYSVLKAAISPTIEAIEFALEQPKLRSFILSSTSEVYSSGIQHGINTIPTAEDAFVGFSDPSNPRWSYASGKIAAEIACLSAFSQHQLPATIIRFHNVYGPRMGNDHFIPEFAKRALAGDLSLPGGNETRSFIHIKDAINATLSLANNKDAMGEIVHVGNDDERPIVDVAKVICESLGIEKPKIEVNDSLIGSVGRRLPDIEKMKKLIDYRQTIPLEDGIASTLNAIRTETL